MSAIQFHKFETVISTLNNPTVKCDIVKMAVLIFIEEPLQPAILVSCDFALA